MASIKVSKTLDLGSIPSTPAKLSYLFFNKSLRLVKYKEIINYAIS